MKFRTFSRLSTLVLFLLMWLLVALINTSCSQILCPTYSRADLQAVSGKDKASEIYYTYKTRK